MKKLILFISLLQVVNFSYSQSQNKDVSDTFESNNNEWPITKETDRSAEIKGGYYILVNNSTEKELNVSCNKGADLRDLDFTIETTINTVKYKDIKYYGIRFGENTSNAVDFYISTNGKFAIQEYYNEEFHAMQEWTSSKAIREGKTTNTLKVIRKANHLQFLVNGEVVYNCFEKIYFGHITGFVVAPGITIKADNLNTWTSKINIPTVADPMEEVQFENLGEGINSDAAELLPIITADGQELYFVRNELVNGVIKNQIYTSVLKNDNTWAVAVKSPSPLNTKGNCGVISVSTDKNTVMISNMRNSSEEVISSKGFCSSHKTATGWSSTENNEVEELVNLSENQELCLSSTNKQLVLTIQGADTRGSRDLYISFFKKGKWQTPINMGDIVNTVGKEMSPFLAADDKTLYFSSEGHPGYGYTDVFMTKRLDDTWLNWSKPLNLGKGINGTGDDIYFTVMANGEYGYISKNLEEGFGNTDLYRIQLSKSARPEALVLVQGKVLNKKTNEPIEAEISYFELGTTEEIGVAHSAPATGEYQVSLDKGKKYAYYAAKEGFYSVEDNLDLVELDEFKSIERTLYLAPIEKGEVIRLNNLFFDRNKASLQEESNIELNKLVQILKKDKNLRIKIVGHTDNVGPDAANLTLSKNRAETVYNYLMTKGVTKEQLQFIGYGEAKPIESNETEEGRSINRRVEFEVL